MAEFEQKELYDEYFEGDQNQVLLRGWLAEPIKFDHQTENIAIYTTKLRIERKPGVVDIIPLYIKESKLALLNVRPSIGDYMEISGRFYSLDIYSQDMKRTLETYVYVRKIRFCNLGIPSTNEIHLTGEILKCRKPRKMKNGDNLIDFLLKVRRKNHRFSKLPCIVWGTYNSFQIEGAGIGAKLELNGRIQSRKYIKNENGVEISRTVYEISVTNFEIKDV